jgi:hypothetical protein
MKEKLPQVLLFRKGLCDSFNKKRQRVEKLTTTEGKMREYAQIFFLHAVFECNDKRKRMNQQQRARILSL